MGGPWAIHRNSPTMQPGHEGGVNFYAGGTSDVGGYVGRYNVGDQSGSRVSLQTGDLPGYAQGTSSVPPAPGQTVTSGSWIGPQPTTTTPMPTTGGQSQDLRTKVFGSPGVLRFADGTPDVPMPDNNGPTVQLPSNGAPSFGDSLGMHMGLGAPQPQSQISNLATGPSGAERMGSFLFGTPEYQAGTQLKVNAAQTFQKPEVQQLLATNPDHLAAAVQDPVTAAGHFENFLSAMNNMKGRAAPNQITHVGPNGTSIVKNVDNPEMINSVAAGMGVDPRHAHGMLEPHQFSQQEFESAMADMPIVVAEHLWNMQHYLNPQQQAAVSYLGSLNQRTSAAQKALQDAQSAGHSAGITTAQKALAQAQADSDAATKFYGMGQIGLYAPQ